MATWDRTTGRFVYWEPEDAAENPGWKRIDCGCCNGLEWGGEEPLECDRCVGNGILFWHVQSGVVAKWVGGPIVERLPKSAWGNPSYQIHAY
jgi:hypothetical protein